MELCLIVINNHFLFYIVKKRHTHFCYIVWQSSWLCNDFFLLMQPTCLKHALQLIPAETKVMYLLLFGVVFILLLQESAFLLLKGSLLNDY